MASFGHTICLLPTLYVHAQLVSVAEVRFLLWTAHWLYRRSAGLAHLAVRAKCWVKLGSVFVQKWVHDLFIQHLSAASLRRNEPKDGTQLELIVKRDPASGARLIAQKLRDGGACQIAGWQGTRQQSQIRRAISVIKAPLALVIILVRVCEKRQAHCGMQAEERWRTRGRAHHSRNQ